MKVQSDTNLDKTYDPSRVEERVYERWQRANAFRAVPDERPPERRFTVMIPLPNVTGALHLGHAINETLQDVMTRWHRMRGFNSLWQPGTDHAGIATQAVVERRIFEQEGKSRHDLGRDELVRRIWEWKDQYEARIIGQLQQMGCSCDWERTRFTLDEVCTKAVRQAFFKLFRDGLIFRGKRLVNWDTQLQTAVADDEVYHQCVRGKLTHIRYPVTGSDAHVVVATTRPETMLGDTAVAVHPEDDRYTHLIGKTCTLPLMEREIPIIADPMLVDMAFGTGCVKVTPAHDPNDYECGLRNKLEMINILTPDGRINDNGGAYAGLDRHEARNKVVADLEARHLIEKVEDYEHDVGHSDRSKTPIEPYLSDQWFVKMGDITANEPRTEVRGSSGVMLADGTVAPGLAQAAIDAVKDGRVKIFPERYAKTYLDWLGEKRDWCISRQLWWGHRIPVWSRVFHLTEKNWPDQLLPTNMDDLLEGNWGDGVETRVSRTSDGAVVVDPQRDFFPVTAEDEGEYVFHVCCLDDDSLAIKFLEDVGFERDPDVLDTWFSSALWPFSTLGWPDEEDSKKFGLDYYYPGTVLITSRDIITLWVARMVLSGLYHLGDIPFRHVYIHTKLLDGRGETMSKSKGNGVDPADIIRLYGADALRYSIADLATEMQDVRMPVDYRCPHCAALIPQTAVVPRNKRPADITTVSCKTCKKTFATQWASDELKAEHQVALETSDRFELGRNFCNKLWNAARFAFMNLEGASFAPIDVAALPPEDRWILASLSRTIAECHDGLSRYQFAATIKNLRDFFWDSFCDWYVELAKARFSSGGPAPVGDGGADAGAAEARQVLAFCLDQILRLLHPFVPFVTEHLWQRLNEIVPRRGLPGVVDLEVPELLTVAPFPPAEGWLALADDAIGRVFADLQAATRGVRELRNRYKVSPRARVPLIVRAPIDRVAALQMHAHILRHMANVGEFQLGADVARPANAATSVVGDLQVFIPGIGDDEAERLRITKQLVGVDKQIGGKDAKLANRKFVENARPEVVEAERARLAELCIQRDTLTQSLAALDN